MEYFTLVCIMFFAASSCLCGVLGENECPNKCQRLHDECTKRDDISNKNCRRSNLFCRRTCNEEVNDAQTSRILCLQQCSKSVCGKGLLLGDSCLLCVNACYQNTHVDDLIKTNDEELKEQIQELFNTQMDPSVKSKDDCWKNCYEEYFLCKQQAAKIMEVFDCTDEKNDCKKSCAKRKYRS